MKVVQFLIIMSVSLLALNVTAQDKTISTTVLSNERQLPAGQVIEAQKNEADSSQIEISQYQAFMKANDLIQAFEKNPANAELAEQAIEWLKQSLQKTGDNELLFRKTAMNNLAVLLIRLKQYDEAQAWLLKSLNEERWVATTLSNLNQLYAYQAQKVYKDVFEKTVLQIPQGEFLTIPSGISQKPQPTSNKKIELETNVKER